MDSTQLSFCASRPRKVEFSVQTLQMGSGATITMQVKAFFSFVGKAPSSDQLDFLSFITEVDLSFLLLTTVLVCSWYQQILKRKHLFYLSTHLYFNYIKYYKIQICIQVFV